MAGREFYDDGYFEAFGTDQLSVMERRLNDSITAVASLIIGAWEQAGRPAIPPAIPRTPRPVDPAASLRNEQSALRSVLAGHMDVYLIPTRTPDRYELYYEAPDEEIVDTGEGSGLRSSA